MKKFKKRVLRELNQARSAGCSCITHDEREICGACLASDILRVIPPHPRHGFKARAAGVLLKTKAPDPEA